MFESAVCPNIAQRIQEQCSPDWIEVYRKTGGTQKHKDHSACTKATCFANDLRSPYIQPRHTSLGCSCTLRGADFRQLQQTLESHGAALLRLDEKDEKIEIKVEPMINDTKYFAISHALADGLCNTERNELPECQLRRILRSVKSAMLIQRLPQNLPVYVWIDIMCLPLRSSPFTGVSTSTIQILQFVMINAFAVVVLDTDIADLRRTSPRAEIFLKISFSSWGSLLWTLFEAMIAQKLLFECRDGVMELQEILESSTDVPTTEDGSNWPLLLYARLGNSSKHERDNRVLLEHALKWGRTSIDSDSSKLKRAIMSLLDVPVFDLYTFLISFNSQQRLEVKESGVIDTSYMAEVYGSRYTVL